MIEPSEFLREIIDPACAALTGQMGRDMGEDRARVMMLAIAYQESNLEHRRQIRGPARGFWQFERGGGTAGVLNHERSKAAAKASCEAMGVEPEVGVVYEALASDDNLAACFARLLLWTDPKPLPAIGDEEGAWQYYLANWRPGKPHRARWSQAHALAVRTVLGGTYADEVVVASVPASTAAAAVKAERGTLKVQGAKSVEVVLPKMARSWQTGEFWLVLLAFVADIAVVAAPVIDPALDKLQASSFMGSNTIAASIFAVARLAYKAWRTQAAVKVASAEVGR